MLRPLCLSIAMLTLALAPATDPNEVLRTAGDTYASLKATKAQTIILHKIEDKFGSTLAKLRKENPSDYLIKRDALNDKFTREFMAAMTPIQKSAYRKVVRSLRQGFIKTHPDVDADNIFIWGGANLL
jgi:hypothetical protein